MTEERRPWQDMPEWNLSPLDIESLNQAHIETAEATWTGRGWCNGCMQRWPCTTRQLLGLLAEAEARATAAETMHSELLAIRPTRGRLQDKLEQARAALERYGGHDTFNGESQCDKTCVCGWAAALEETK